MERWPYDLQDAIVLWWRRWSLLNMELMMMALARFHDVADTLEMLLDEGLHL